MEVVNYRITEGSDYQWICYGNNSYCLDSWNGDQDGHSLSIIFDTNTQEVYEVQAHDYQRHRAYRLINPNYKSIHDNEADQRGISKSEAWDNLKYIDLDVDEDWLEKAQAIVSDEDYDTRVKVPIDFSDEELLQYMKMAHDLDMTFNKFVEMVLKEAIDQHRMLNDDLLPEYDFSEAEPGPVEKAVKILRENKKGQM